MSELQEIWERQKKFDSNFKALGSLSIEEKERWTKDHILYIQSELIELAENLDWKIHRKEAIRNIVTSNIREEIIDAFKYLLGLALIWDMTPEQFLEEFRRKSEVVEQKFIQEFSKTFDREKFDGLVVVDIDGVLADYTGGFKRFIEQETGLSLPEPKQYDLYGEFGRIVGHEKMYELKHKFRESGEKAKLDVIPGAVDLMNYLKLTRRKYLLLMSARPYKKYKRIMADTIEWLRAKGIPFDSILWDENKEERIIKEYSFADFVIEDNLNNAISIASKSGVPVCLMDRPYNQWPTARNPDGLSIARFKDHHELIETLSREYFDFDMDYEKDEKENEESR